MSPPGIRIADYKGFIVYLPRSGGKAGKGRNRTSALQLRRGGRIERQFRFELADQGSREAAIAKAKAWADAEIVKESTA